MSGVKKVIQLHSIRVTSSTNPHDDLPGDMKMSAQLIIEDVIFLQTLPVASQHNQMNWKFVLGCNIPPHSFTFSVAFLRQSETEGTRLVGYIEIRRDEVLASVKSNRSFRLQLNKVNPDGPSLTFSTSFSVFESLYYEEPSGLDLIRTTENTISSVKGRSTASELPQMYIAFAQTQLSMDAAQLRIVHERLLFCKSDGLRANWLNFLGNILLESYQGSRTVDDLNQAVCAYKDAVRDDPGPVTYLSDLAKCLQLRFQQLGNLLDINHSVVMLEAAVGRTGQDDQGKPQLLNDLGHSLFIRFERLGDVTDINRSISRLEAAVTLTPDGHPDKPSRLNNLGNSFVRRFGRLGDLPDLQLAVLKYEAAINLIKDGDPDKPSVLNNLGVTLRRRFERLGNLTDLDLAVLRIDAALTLIPDGHPSRYSWLSNLGSCLLIRFQQLGSLDDLNQCLLRMEAAVNLAPDGHPDKPGLLSNLAESLRNRFDQLGGLDDVNRSILLFEAAISLTPDGHPARPKGLNNLGNSFSSRFARLGDLMDLQLAVLKLDAAVNLTPDGHPDKPSWLMNLANTLFRRFERLGGLDDLNQSVMMSETAVTLTPDGDPGKPSRLGGLGNFLVRRFKRLGNLTDLQSAVLRLEAAVILTPDGHLDKPLWQSGLGDSLLCRFEQLGVLDDLNQSVLRSEVAVTITPDGHPNKPLWLNNLGCCLLTRFHQLGSLDDLNQSVLRFDAAVALTPDGHPDKPVRLCNLGNSLHQRFEQLHDPQDSQQFILHYSSAACSATGPASVRFDAAERWARHAHIHQPSSVLHAYTTVIELLPEIAYLGLSITDRHHHLSKAGEVVRAAASAAITMQDYQKAVEWLDQGRSVIWGQLLNLRTPVDELRKSHPGLANELVSLSASLETAGTRGNLVADAVAPQPLQSIAQQSYALALKRNLILQEIRELPRFESFLLSKPISELMRAANMGPVAILNTSAYGCDALILMPGPADEIIHVPLSNFTIHEAQTLAESLASIVGTEGRSDRLGGFRDSEGDMASDDAFSHVLSELWCKIVQPVLKRITITTPVSQDLGRIWWCPTGPLAFLPIHAAGLYGKDQAVGSKLSEFLVSSYTPSLTALIEGFRPRAESNEDLQLLAVTQPSADGQGYIPGIKKEIHCIQQHARGKITIQWLDQQMATIDSVQKGMMNSRWVHFACHGVQSASPTESALLLAGSSRFTLFNIIQLSLPNADLAFLSACQTATGSKDLQDELVHLAAGMLLAGYRGVIGTMWSIMDNDAPQVAGDVYAHLLKVSPPDSTRAAEALHLAVCKLREQNKSFLRWVPFIHLGV